ncbi:protein of unknown function (DUF928) [Xenococcus sp. PCC 7305]|uniref:DUF928 domain-containing protein n=1 Tax=Xenococcus sp. PCC 7305 TaxID=102125 RepID=UPI0002ACCBD1|nr:DUF928 domain-containing protein [Xenococcus sp. PCC 7305]ELS00666.1 protein of unknown function (DUF928) [Xenococcus sp. PCC 7305]
MNRIGWQNLVGTTFSIIVVVTANIAMAELSFKEAHKSLVALEFELPDDPVPDTSVGGGVRGKVQFALPDESSSPKTNVGSGVRGDVEFAFPDREVIPKTNLSSGVRGDVEFELPDQDAAPDTTVGAGVRGDVEFELPDQDAAPNTTVGTGVRGQELALTALVPKTKHGRTVSTHPTFFVYLPPIGAQEVFFSIQDEAGNSHYHAMVKVPISGGIISIKIPDSAPELELRKNYLWYFAPIEPEGILRPDNYAVTGWVKRVETDINRQELANSPVQLATEYAKAGIWYNTVEVLVAAQNLDPNNQTLADEWHDLLEQVELQAIQDKSIFDQLLQFSR